MDTANTKVALAYREIKCAMRSGRYAPGQRLNPDKLAEEFHISSTPVRRALQYLAGETLVIGHPNGGLQAPMPTDTALHDLYDWMERLLLMTCDIGMAPMALKTEPLKLSSAEDDLARLTWQLFDAIAHMTIHGPLRHAVRQTNDLLAPIRQIELELIEHPFEELSELNRHWQKRDTPALKAALRDYHERREQLVPYIVTLLNDRSD